MRKKQNKKYQCQKYQSPKLDVESLYETMLPNKSRVKILITKNNTSLSQSNVLAVKLLMKGSLLLVTIIELAH